MHFINTTSDSLVAMLRIRHSFVAVVGVFLLLMAATGLKNQASAVPVTSGLVAHFDAQTNSSILKPGGGVAANGELVDTWEDLVAGIHDASPSVSLEGPTYNATGAPNNLPSLTFDGLGDRLTTASPTLVPLTVVFFHRWIKDLSDATGEYLLDTRSGVSNGYVWSGGLGANWTGYVNDSTTSTGSIGAFQSEVWQMSTFTGLDAGPNDIDLMTPGGASETSPGDLGELLIYNRVITESERLLLFDYIDARWVNIPPVPEPSTFALLTLGVLGLMGRKRRRGNRMA